MTKATAGTLTALLATVLIFASPGCGASEGTKNKGTVKKQKKATFADLMAAAATAEKEGQPSLAEKKYRRARRIKPKSFEATAALAKLLIKEGQPTKAAEVTKDYHERVPTDFKGYILHVTSLMAVGDWKSARARLDELIDLDPKNALAHELRGRVKIMMGKKLEAIPDFREAVKLDPDNADFRVSLGSGLHQNEKLEEAALVLRGALQLDKEHARAHLILGLVLRDQSEYKDAVTHHLRAARIGKSGRAYYELGRSQFKLGDSLGAQQSITRAVEAAPKKALYWYALGEISRANKAWKNAVTAYETAIKLDPQYAKAYNKLGLVLFHAKDLKRAEKVLTEAIRNNSKDPYASFNIGLVYEAQQKWNLALAALRRYLELAPPEDGDRRNAQKAIRRIRYKMRKR